MKKIDLIGKRFYRLQVIEETGKSHKWKGILYKCLCDCGNITLVYSKNLRRNHTKSCGCLHKDIIKKIGQDNKKHGFKGTSTYYSWQSMKQRCLNENSPDYQWYGAIGINIYDKWINSFENFLIDMGERPEGKTLDRINPYGNYEPSNCKWSTPMEQRHNRREN